MTDFPGKQYTSCTECGRQVQVHPVDRALMVWLRGKTICAACAAGGRHREPEGEEMGPDGG